MTTTRGLPYQPIEEVKLTEALDLAKFFYGILADFPEDEKWNSVIKIRNSATDLLYYIAQAVGNGSPTTHEYDWGNVRKHALSLKTLYRFAHKQDFVTVDPDIMVRIDKLLKDIDKSRQQAYQQTKNYNEREDKRWRDRYETWKKTEEGYSR